MSLSYKQNKKALYKVFKKYIKVKKEYLKEANKFIKENFKNKKILGVHWRGDRSQSFCQIIHFPQQKNKY